jgi:hypothetical protein
VVSDTISALDDEAVTRTMGRAKAVSIHETRTAGGIRRHGVERSSTASR